MIGDTKRAKGWSTAEQQGIEFVTYTVNPWGRRIEQSIRKQLINPTEWNSKEAVLVTQALMRGDAKSRVEYYDKMKALGALTPNEIRKLEDFNLREDENGDKFVISTKKAKLGRLIFIKQYSLEFILFIMLVTGIELFNECNCL